MEMLTGLVRRSALAALSLVLCVSVTTFANEPTNQHQLSGTTNSIQLLSWNSPATSVQFNRPSGPHTRSATSKTNTSNLLILRRQDHPGRQRDGRQPDTGGQNDAFGALATSAQFEGSANELAGPQDVSLYQTIRSQSNDTQAANINNSYKIGQLNQNFLALFDELWRIKNTSVTALLRLDYFNQTLQSNQQDQREFERQRPRTRNGFKQQNETGRDAPLADHNQQQQQQSKQQAKNQVGALAAARLTSWLEALRRRFQLAMDSFNSRLMAKLALANNRKASPWLQAQRAPNGPTQSKQTNLFDSVDKIIQSDESNARAEPPHLIAKRQAPVSGPNKSCNLLSGAEEAKCRSIEQLISYNLNNSFPGTSRAIEENCKLISSLFTGCWPDQLLQLRGSLSSWNESLLLHTDFPLPGNFMNQKQAANDLGAPQSCGLVPQLAQFLRDRINWMWLNLCIDKKFRQDYVEHLRCLSTWTQEKAQHVCNHEYRRMQTYLVSQAETGNALGNSFEWAHGSNNQRTRQTAPSDEQAQEAAASGESRPSPDSGQLGQMGANKVTLSESELTDREVSSKLLCCMFDQFLRCVHKQAARDCGRQGAQFVVNFMSRIGTDDMKFLCNSETKSTSNRAQSKQSGRRGSLNESRSPFIEGHYCTDSRIQLGLSNNQIDRSNANGSPNGQGNSSHGVSHNSKSSTGGSRVKSKSQAHISHDPTFFTGDTGHSTAALMAANSLTQPRQLCFYLALIVVFVFISRL